MLHGVEGADVAVDVLFEAAGKLRLVVGLEGEHVEPVSAHGDGARILGADRQVPGHRARRDIDDGDPVACRERHVCLLVAGEGHAHGFVEARGEALGMDVLHRGDDMMEERTLGVRVDHAHGVGDVVGDPDFAAVRAHRDAHGIDADGDAVHELAAGGVDDVHRVGRRVGDVDEAASDGDGIEVGAGEGRVPDSALLPTLVARGGADRAGEDGERQGERGINEAAADALSRPRRVGEAACPRHGRTGRPHACLQRLCVLTPIALETSAKERRGQGQMEGLSTQSGKGSWRLAVSA